MVTSKKKSNEIVPADIIEFIQNVRDRVAKVVVGQEVVVERLLIEYVSLKRVLGVALPVPAHRSGEMPLLIG